jgi:hypothetical protein
MADVQRGDPMGRNETKRGVQMKKSSWLFVYSFLFLAIITSPFWLWQLKPASKVNVLIMDKTVPDQSYREHKGLVWFLNNSKYVKKDLSSYALNSDYKGFEPETGTKYKIANLPKSLTPYDVIYMTDQYGVYKDELTGNNQGGNRSEKVYGGLSLGDVDKIEKTLTSTKGKTLISEFNTFASPTSDTVRAKISNLLDLDWTGWIGRYFSDLNSSEVPEWVKTNYEKEHRKWNFSGKGIVLVNKNDYVVVIDKNELKDDGLLYQVTNNGEKQFSTNLKGVYQYWFDINQPRNKEEVLANYQFPISDKAKKELNGYGIPTSFPAVIYHQTATYSSYYFSGDFADETDVPAIYQTVGLDYWKEYLGNRGSFYWGVYVPMMKSIFKSGLHQDLKQEQVESVKVDGVTVNSRTSPDYIQIRKNGKWQSLLIKGVNMGVGKPGYFPGETAITKTEYLRWFQEIGAMNANAIRIYTIHPPAFYEAFYEYNQMAKKPLYLFHGTWVNEDNLNNTKDAYAEINVNDAKTEIKNVIDIIHGNANIPARPGHASGVYKYDISKYVLGFIIGTEWDPQMVKNTNTLHQNVGQFNGDYFKTQNASPFEVWLAQLMNYSAQYETDTYHWQHSTSFTNWLTTDLLSHPYEPLENEDLVSVDPNHIAASGQFHAGLFASYHVYPYYPDFLNYTPDYLHYVDSSGKKNNYAGYLHDLRQANHMPVLVAEFGVPASRGLTHLNAYGMNQGFHSEQEQGQMDKKLFTSIVSEGYAGGLVFSWQDEWFKDTWNTMDLDDPNRRPYWSNVQTNEEHFGLLGFDPGTKDTSIQVDSEKSDWDMAGVKPIYQSKSKQSPLNEVRMYSDDAYLYFLLTYNQPVDFSKQGTYLLLDTIKNQGQTNIQLNDQTRIKTDYGIDFLIKLTGPESSRIMVDSYYDPFYYEYENMLHLIPEQPYANQKDNGVFNPIRLALDKGGTIPATQVKIPFKAYETGKLRYGDANPEHKDFNSLTDISISKDKKVIEGRIPWQLLNVKDPSQKEIMGDVWKSGLTGSQTTDGIRVAVAVANKQKLEMTFPQETNGQIAQNQAVLYQWKGWDQPAYYERLKSSYGIMKNAYGSAKIK